MPVTCLTYSVGFSYDSFKGPYAHLLLQRGELWTQNWSQGNAQFFCGYLLNWGEQTTGDDDFASYQLLGKNLWWWYPESEEGSPNATLLTCSFIPCFGRNNYYTHYWFAKGQLLINFVPARLWKEPDLIYGYQLRCNCPRLTENNYSVLMDATVFGDETLGDTQFLFIGGYVDEKSVMHENDPHMYAGWAKCPEYFIKSANIPTLILPTAPYITTAIDTAEVYGIARVLENESQQIVETQNFGSYYYTVWNAVVMRQFGWNICCGQNYPRTNFATSVMINGVATTAPVNYQLLYDYAIIAGDPACWGGVAAGDYWEYTENKGPEGKDHDFVIVCPGQNTPQSIEMSEMLDLSQVTLPKQSSSTAKDEEKKDEGKPKS